MSQLTQATAPPSDVDGPAVDDRRGAGTTPPTRRRRRGFAVAAVAVLAVAGTATAVVLRSPSDDHPPSVTHLRLAASAAPNPALAEAEHPQAPDPAGRGAATAVLAVRDYLAAQAGGDAGTGLGLLTHGVRQQLGSAAALTAAWGAASRPTSVGALTALPGTITADQVRADVRYQPSLDLFAGFTPARRTEVWAATREADGWHVDPALTTADPVLPSPQAAGPVVAAWLRDACDVAAQARLQAADPLVGSPDLAALPCRTPGAWTTGALANLPAGPRSEPFLDAYGPDTPVWAKGVPVTGPNTHLIVGVAPWGDGWRVFGVVSDGAGG